VLSAHCMKLMPSVEPKSALPNTHGQSLRHFSRATVVMTSVAREKWRQLWPWVLGNALFGSTLGISFMQWALSTSTPTAIVLAIIATTPLAVIPLARIFEGEHVSHRAIVGAAIAVAGVVGLVGLH